MRSEHRKVFFDVAQRFKCWIGLREPNPLYDNWFGKPGYVPKDEKCKAKTADNSTFRFAGLVVSPILCPQAFKPSSLAAATATWKKDFLQGGRVPPGFTCVEDGPEKGVVKRSESYLFADFDLMAVNRSSEGGDFLVTSQDEQRRLYEAVKPALNRGLRVPMIQHGAEMMWEKGVGGREKVVHCASMATPGTSIARHPDQPSSTASPTRWPSRLGSQEAPKERKDSYVAM